MATLGSGACTASHDTPATLQTFASAAREACSLMSEVHSTHLVVYSSSQVPLVLARRTIPMHGFVFSSGHATAPQPGKRTCTI